MVACLHQGRMPTPLLWDRMSLSLSSDRTTPDPMAVVPDPGPLGTHIFVRQCGSTIFVPNAPIFVLLKKPSYQARRQPFVGPMISAIGTQLSVLLKSLPPSVTPATVYWPLVSIDSSKSWVQKKDGELF